MATTITNRPVATEQVFTAASIAANAVPVGRPAIAAVGPLLYCTDCEVEIDAERRHFYLQGYGAKYMPYERYCRNCVGPAMARMKQMQMSDAATAATTSTTNTINNTNMIKAPVSAADAARLLNGEELDAATRELLRANTPAGRRINTRSFNEEQHLRAVAAIGRIPVARRKHYIDEIIRQYNEELDAMKK